MVDTSRRVCTLAAAVLLVLPAAACTAQSPPPPAASTQGSSGGQALPAPRDLASTNATTIKASPSPDWAIAAGDSVWVAGVGPGLQRYDATTATPTGAQNLKSVCLGMDQGFGSVWAGSCSYDKPALVRLDTATGKLLAQIPLPQPPAQESSIGAGEGAVWLLNFDGTQIMVVDPHTNTVGRPHPAPPGAAALRAGHGAVWVSVSPRSSTAAPGSLVRLNPSTGDVVATIGLGPGPRFLAIGPDAVWVMNQGDGTVSRVDPLTNRVTATITVSSRGITGGDIAAGADAVWVRVSDALAVRIDPKTNTVADRLGPSAGSGGVAIATTSVWFTAHDVQTIWRLPQS